MSKEVITTYVQIDDENIECACPNCKNGVIISKKNIHEETCRFCKQKLQWKNFDFYKNQLSK